MLFLLFFFFKQKTAYEMRISDWSSDVCSSDLVFTEIGESYYSHITTGMIELASATAQVLHKDNVRYLRLWCVPGFAAQWLSEQLANFERHWHELTIEMRPTDDPADLKIGRASGRERGCRQW